MEHDWQREKDRQARRTSQPRQEPLPFGDNYLDDDELVVEIHGTSLGVRRHLAASEDLCTLCAGWVDELVEAGYAAPWPAEAQRS